MHYQKKTLDIDTTHKYVIDTTGVVTNETTGRVLKGTKVTKANRYVKIILNKRYLLHKLVAQTFVPNPNDLPQVNHIDGNRMNNAASNLEWVTGSQNVKHAYDTGLKSNAGELNPISKLTEDVVVDIWRLAKQGHKPSSIIRLLKLNVCRSTVSSVTNGKNWAHVTSTLEV